MVGVDLGQSNDPTGNLRDGPGHPSGRRRRINAGLWKTANPQLSNNLDLFPGIPCRWGLGYMITTQPGPNGRSAGSLTWGGIHNTYYWLSRTRNGRQNRVLLC